MTTQTLEATYRDGVLHLSRPLDLADAAHVEVVVRPAAHPVAPSDPDDLEAMRLRRLAILEKILAIPSEAKDRSLHGRDHDRILYGGPDGVR